MPVANLSQAAQRTPLDLTTRYITDQAAYSTAVKNFWTAANVVFENAVPNDHPMIGWIAIIAATQQTIAANLASNAYYEAFPLLEVLIQQMYRMLALGYYLHDETNPPMMSNAQNLALRQAYNDFIFTA